jgi:hypothetical protein
MAVHSKLSRVNDPEPLPPPPAFDPRESPLSPGGRPDPFGRQVGGAEHLHGLTDFPTTPHPRRGLYKVRREGWVSRREAARERYREISAVKPSSESRILGKLAERGGLLDRARANAIHPRFNLRTRP